MNPRVRAVRPAVLLAALLALALPPAGAQRAILRIDGEVYARRTAALMPPSVDRLWQFNITQLAADGAPVAEGDVVVAFDSSEIARQLGQKQSELEAKRRELEKLDLDLAERERTAQLATAQARAELDKAQRKTEQPRELIAALEYGKLVEERRRAERRAVLAERRERLAAEQRRQERRLTVSELGQLQADVTRLQQSLAALNLPAPRAGVMMHRSNWNNEKFDVGSQVWRGQTVAEIPDTTTLAVRAELPERELQRVAVGAPARIVVEGGGGSVHLGKVGAIGRAVRSKSQVQPIPVLDLEIALDDPAARLRPGQSVRVELAVAGDTRGAAE
ncbi:HlyD family efflux transporter periplasmic adaptor subunit [Luteimonas sp. BDR2-5]|uniref:HlyD family secretion protein n=1 Tax=Proluteimonas luteida TaxID=2878685 RepID=UPI001E553BBC|nr:HlyD family efflux transporter periplasmic adaptor subunit [Luteimonas sp. BDR2-5]MCD9028015.1 HlyD family efflux transporter periplasmic adaptor subunit [Luteimonas sp. BDR2-5]